MSDTTITNLYNELNGLGNRITLERVLQNYKFTRVFKDTVLIFRNEFVQVQLNKNDQLILETIWSNMKITDEVLSTLTKINSIIKKY